MRTQPVSSPNEKTLHVLTGPTAVGKTEAALSWAERYGAEIISCDSLLFYRGMDIGTAKPTAVERARVRHHLIDIRNVAEPMDITHYVERSKQAVADIYERGHRILVTGGSGFYLRTFFAPVADDVVVPPELRITIEMEYQERGLSELVAALAKLNPSGLGELDTANPRRVLRALERCRASGRTLAEMSADFAKKSPPFSGWTAKLVCLDRSAAELDRRILKRVNTMLADGLVAEVERLLQAGLKRNPSAAKAIGYRETIAVLEGRLDPKNLASAIFQSTKGLVKKQRTWFRTQLPIHAVIGADEALSADLFSAKFPPHAD